MKKDHLSHFFHKLAAIIPLLLLLYASAFIYRVEQKSELSSNSLAKIEEINNKYDLFVSKDLNPNTKNRMLAELFEANLLDLKKYDKSQKGLILSFKNQEMLLIQPMYKIQDKSLKNIAKEYMDKVPELQYAEIDQDLNLEGYPVYDFEFSEEIESTEEVRENTVKVALLDSGIDKNHDFFIDKFIGEGWNTVSDSADVSDDISHGTHMAGIIATTDPEAEIIPYKIADKNGGRLSNVLAAMSLALEEDVDVINTSFVLSSNSYALYKLINLAEEKGIIIVAAAGNNNSNANFYPAAYDYVIGVASVDEKGKKMPKSNYGAFVDLASLGSKIYSTVPGNGYEYKSGTSPATAHVSGVVARILEEFPDLNLELIIIRLKDAAELSNSEELAGVAIVK